MARSAYIIEKDLRDCHKALEQTNPKDKEWDALISKRNELMIELCQSTTPIDKEPEITWVYLPSKINNL